MSTVRVMPLFYQPLLFQRNQISLPLLRGLAVLVHRLRVRPVLPILPVLRVLPVLPVLLFLLFRPFCPCRRFR